MADMLDEIGAYLQTESVGTVGTDIWLGELQPTPDDAVGLFETPGASPEVFDRTDYPTLQVRVRSRLYSDGRTRIQSIFELLHGLAETDLSGTRYHLIRGKQTPFYLGQVDLERHEFVCNFAVTRRDGLRTPPSER